LWKIVIFNEMVGVDVTAHDWQDHLKPRYAGYLTSAPGSFGREPVFQFEHTEWPRSAEGLNRSRSNLWQQKGFGE
jgi:hypothetical protein